MKLAFVVNGQAGELERSWATGRAVLRLGDEEVTLQNPWSLSTHFGLSTTKTWRARLAGHDVEVVRKRARIYGGVREADFKVIVDGAEVTAQRGL